MNQSEGSRKIVRRFFPTHHKFLNSVIGGLERGKVWWIDGAGPVGSSDLVWFSIDLAVNSIVKHGGKLGIICYSRDPNPTASYVPLVNKSPLVVKSIVRSAQQSVANDASVILFDQRNSEPDDSAMIKRAIDEHSLDAVILEGDLITAPDGAEKASVIEDLARESDSCIVVNPWISWSRWMDDPDPETEIAQREKDAFVRLIRDGKRNWMELTPIWSFPQFNSYHALRIDDRILKTIASCEWTIRVKTGHGANDGVGHLLSASLEVVIETEPAEATEEVVSFISSRADE